MALKTNLAFHLSLEESSGTRVDDHTNSIDFTDNNTVGSGTGKLGTCAVFVRANSEYLGVAESAPVDTGTDTAWTIAAWVKTSYTSGDQIVLTKSNAGSRAVWRRNVYGLVVTLTDGKPHAICGNNSSFGDAVWGSSIADGNWHFLVAWHDPTADEVGIQVDNGTPVTSAWSGGTYNNNYNVTVGAGAAPTDYFDGSIDNIALWIDRVLSSADRSELWNSGSGLAFSSWDTGGAASLLLPRTNRAIHHLLIR